MQRRDCGDDREDRRCRDRAAFQRSLQVTNRRIELGQIDAKSVVRQAQRVPVVTVGAAESVSEERRLVLALSRYVE
ncbi:hypothetical protein QT600_22605, partial [Xanthomonas citri pv. citri]